jgi:hypothetical protein
MTRDDLKSRPWWPAVEALRKLGHDVMVWDPALQRHFTDWDGDYGRGGLTLVPTAASSWKLFVDGPIPIGLEDEDTIDDARSSPLRW